MRIDIIKTTPSREVIGDYRTKLVARIGTINAIEMKVDNDAEIQQIIDLCVSIANSNEPLVMVVKEVQE